MAGLKATKVKSKEGQKGKEKQANNKSEPSAQKQAGQEGASKDIKAKPSQSEKFSRFTDFPQEIQNSIWTQALINEAKHTIVLFEHRCHALIPSVQLISRISLVNKAARSIATEFYDVKLDVFACIREPEGLFPHCREAKGILRLNFEHTTLYFGNYPLWYIEEFDSDTEDYDTEIIETDYADWSGSRSQVQSDSNHALWVTRSHITNSLNSPQHAKIKRAYMEIGAPTECASFVTECDMFPGRCCWKCTWRSAHNGGSGVLAPFSGLSKSVFPNVWLHRLFIIDDDYNPDDLLKHYAELHSEELWRHLSSRLVTCWNLPFRPIDDYEIDSDGEEIE